MNNNGFVKNNKILDCRHLISNVNYFLGLISSKPNSSMTDLTLLDPYKNLQNFELFSFIDNIV